VDIIIQIKEEEADKLAAALAKRDMPLPAEIVRQRIKDRRGDVPLNAIHGSSGYKADLYLLREGDALRQEAFRRRTLVDLGPGLGELYLHTPEDLILNKLLFYSLSQQTQHVHDIASIIQVMGDQLDRAYLARWVAEKDLRSLWDAIQLQIQSKD
jgi:hypothetical protein